MRKIAMMASLAIALPVASAAADWVELPTNGQAKAYIDTASIVSDGSTHKYWLKAIPPKRLDGADYLIVQEKIRCRERESAILMMIGYDSAGRRVGTETSEPHDLEWRAIVPDTTGEAIYELLCRKS